MKAPSPAATDAPERPAPDEVAETLHPSANPSLTGHARAERFLAATLAGGSLHHAWLFAGPPGIGKATLAYRFARRLLSDTHDAGFFGAQSEDLFVDPDTAVFAQVASGSHPNLLRLRRQWDFKTKKYRSGILVDDVRQLTGFLGQRANRRGRRVVIVDAADDLTGQAENALLKPLEEPPADTIFLLISHQPGALLPTIRSRCRRLDLRSLSPDDAQAVVQRQSPELDAEQASVLLSLSEQSPGAALRLHQADGIVLYREMISLFTKAPAIPREAAQKLAASMERGADAERRFALFCALFEGLLRRLIATSVVPENAVLPPDPGEGRLAERLAGRGLDQWFDLCDNLQRLRERTETVNLNRKAVTLTLVSAFEDAARKAAA